MVVEENRRSMKSNVAYILEREFRNRRANIQYKLVHFAVHGWRVNCLFYLFPGKSTRRTVDGPSSCDTHGYDLRFVCAAPLFLQYISSLLM